MTKVKRVINVFIGLLIVLIGLLITIFAESGFKLAVFLLSVTLLVYSIRQFMFYIKMARHMVGGRAMLYRAIITFDLALFTMSLNDVSPIYVMLYLIFIHAFQGGAGIMEAMETRRAGAHWKLDFARSAVDIAIAILCIIFIKSVTMASFIYGIGLVYSGIVRIIGAFRRNAIVYIQ